MDRLAALSAFVRVAESGSFTRAADALGLPKATLSAQVARLEERLGVRLLHRTTRRLALTDDGRACLERARILLEDYEDLESGLGAAARSPRGRLRIDVPAAFGRHVLVPALPAFFARHPQITLEVGSSDRPVDLLAEGVDCVVRGGEVHDESLVGRRLRTLDVVTCAAPSYLHRRGTPKHPHDLARHDLIGYLSARSGRTYAMDFERGAERIEVAGPWRVSLNDADAYIAAGLAGLGVLQAVRSPYVDALLARGALEPILRDWAVEPLPQHVLYPGRRHLSARVRAFVDWIVEQHGDPGT